MYLVCCQIVAYILKVYSSLFPYTCNSYLTVTELRLLLWVIAAFSALYGLIVIVSRFSIMADYLFGLFLLQVRSSSFFF